MKKQITGKEIVRDMEYLVKLLHKEWERSGRTKAEVKIALADADEIEKRFGAAIQKKQRQLEMQELTFQQSMELSKRNFVILRLVKKIRKEKDKANRKELDLEFTVELDQEEYKFFMETVMVQEES